jgi:hypothetical protein
LRQAYLRTMKRYIDHHANAGIAVSRKMVDALFGSPWEADSQCRLFYCGIDLKPSCTVVDPVSVRAELRIPANAFVVGYVGKFSKLKNHRYLVNIAHSPLPQVSLSRPAFVWVEAILALRDSEPGTTQGDALNLMQRTRLNIVRGMRELQSVYAA